MPLFKFTVEFFVRSNFQEEAEQRIKDELGLDTYENHCICEEVKEAGQEAEFNLITA